MSLQSLIDLRTNSRLAPLDVWLLIGNAPKWALTDPCFVQIKPGKGLVDLRALTGLNVDLVQIEDDTETLNKVLDALAEAKPKTVGFVGPCGAIGQNDTHRECLEKARRLFCS